MSTIEELEKRIEFLEEELYKTILISQTSQITIF